MKLPITYNSNSMTLHIEIGKYSKYLQCPFATWWKARKYFKRPRFKFYFGPLHKYHGKVKTQFGEYDDYTTKGYWPMASTEYLKWYTSKWFPIHVMSWDIGWKDKWNSPRYERPGHFIIFFGRNYKTCWQFSMVVTAPKTFCANDCTIEDNDDNYWESMLWYLNYSDEYNKDIDVERPQGTRTYEDMSLDLIKARETMRCNHWSRSESTELSDIEMLCSGKETLSMGNDKIKMFTYVDLKSDILYNKLYDTYIYPIDNLRSDDSVHISISGTDPKVKNNIKIGQDIFQSSSYVRLVLNDTEDDKDYQFIRVYYRDNDDKIIEHLNNVTDKMKIVFKHSCLTDIGPSFKDEFLNKRGVEIIRKYCKD